MRIVVHGYDVMGMLAISVSHTDRTPVDGVEPLRYERGAHIHVPAEILDGPFADQLAFLGEALLDLAYDRT
jgi:hypothetical protein